MAGKQQGNGAASSKGKALTIQQKAMTIEVFLKRDENKAKMKKALPKLITPTKLISVVMNSIRRNPRIADCTLISIFDCVMSSAQLGILPDDIRGLAYIIPFNNRKKGVMEAQLMLGYKGFIHLAKDSGEVLNVWSRVVYEHEMFHYEEGLNPILEHIPLPPKDRGAVKGAYTCVILKDGLKGFTYMWEDEIQAIRRRSKSPDDGPWKTDPDEMRKKTTIRRDMKTRNLSPKMNLAVGIDEMIDTDASVRNDEFGADEFMTEALPGKPDVEIPKANDEPKSAKPPEHFKPLNDDEESVYSSIIDMSIDMRMEDTDKLERMISEKGLKATFDYVKKEHEKWEIGKSIETRKGAMSEPGTEKR